MGSASGGAPGRLAEFDAGLHLIREWPDNPPQDGFNNALLLAINFADDSVNPPELGFFEREMPRVKHGRFIVVPVGRRSIGHVTAGHADVWENYLKEFLASITDHTGYTRSSLD